MITDAILGVLVTAAEFIVGALPEAGTLGLEGIGPAVGVAVRLNSGLPIAETLAMAGVALTIIGGIFATRLVLTIWHAIPGKLS